MEKNIVKTMHINGKDIDVMYIEAKHPVPPEEMVSTNGMSMLGHGIIGRFNQRTYEANQYIICEQDVPVTMRDGVKIYVDIYRPKNETDIPAIISWSFFGKRPCEGLKEWQIMGIPPGTISDMAKFESPDPGFWCRNGYAVVNVDPRGVGHSEGDIKAMGMDEGEDGYDLVEWLATQHWCNGKIGLSGNSNVAMTQWRIAATCPPHLTCIAPWEGSADIYEELFYEGGIPSLGFNSSIFRDIVGPNYVEDVMGMAEKYPLRNDWWNSKVPIFENIEIPCYATACWNHFHLRGAMRGYREIKSRKKWMRIHREFEWPDLYTPENIQDLKMFFDRYLKDINNGWEMTPRIRLEVMDGWDVSHVKYRGEERFPLRRTQYKKLYIDAANQSMQEEPVSVETSYSYDGNEGICNFDFKFNEDTEITGYMKLHLWVSPESHDDMDMFINIQKLSTTGEWIPVLVEDLPHPGAWGKLRLSYRELDEERSTDYCPILKMENIQKVKPGEIVPVDINIVPHSRFWHKGQSIRVQIAGRYIREDWFEPLSWETDNVGNHIIYSGGKYDSYLQIPVIPPTYRDGDIIYR